LDRVEGHASRVPQEGWIVDWVPLRSNVDESVTERRPVRRLRMG
jgi:hypothetical protein